MREQDVVLTAGALCGLAQVGKTGLIPTRYSSHLPEYLSGLRRVANFPQERDSRSADAIAGFEAQAKSQAID